VGHKIFWTPETPRRWADVLDKVKLTPGPSVVVWQNLGALGHVKGPKKSGL